MKRWMTGIALAGGLAATAAHAGGAPPPDKLDLPLEGNQTSAVVNVPSNDQMQREYPPLALALDLGGSGTITCTVETTGLLSDCKLDSEEPAGLGFGAAALRLAPYFTAKPPTFEGKPVKGSVTIPINFQTGGSTPTEAAPVPAPTSPAALDAARELAAAAHWSSEMQALGDIALTRWTAGLALGGDTVAATRVVDACRMGIQDAIAQELDERERRLASQMTAEQLRATVAFMKSPAGAAYLRAQSNLQGGTRSNFWQNVTTDTRRRLCAAETCSGATGGTPAS